MENEKPGEPPRDANRPDYDAEFENAPPIIKQILWLYRNRRRYWVVILVAFLVLGVGWLAANTWVLSLLGIKSVVDRTLDKKIKQRASELRAHFRHAADILEQSGTADFSDAETDIASLKELDPKNGNAWYYAGEVKRVKDKRFTSERCPKMPLPENGTLITFDKDFYRYLENIKDLPPNETGGNTGVELCYSRANGYCPQRTAWVHHLLANDLYAEATAESDPKSKIEKLKNALGHAKDALKLYPQEGERRAGFVQCIPTESLVRKINEALESSH